MLKQRLKFVHRKSGYIYEVLGFGCEESTGRCLVIYRSTTSTDKVWIRPASEFFDGRFQVEYFKDPDGSVTTIPLKAQDPRS